MKGYDEKYLQGCIDKAKKSWEGVDTDKFMNEIRGRDDAPNEELDDVAILKAIDYTDGIEDGGTEKHPWNDEDVEKAYREGMKAGAEWQLERMLANAVDKKDLELNYKRISRNYKLLKDLLDEGYKIIGVAWGRLEIFYKDVPHLEYSMGGTIPAANEPFCKDEIKRDYPDGYFGYFEKACTTRQIQFVIPNGKFTKEGYEQAEKDLALTWEDVKLLCDCFMDVGLHSDLPARSKSLYEEVLTRFNEQRKI